MTRHRRFVIGLVCIGCFIAMLNLLWYHEYYSFWLVLIGVAGFMIDRLKEDKNDE